MSTDKPNNPPKKSDPRFKRILVVDDDEHILQMIKTTLEMEGFAVQTGRDGKSILRKAQEFKPDLVVTDLMMPGGGGYELLRSLQMDEATRKTPVLVITGRNLDDSTKNVMCQEPNVVDILEKPLRPLDLTIRIHAVLNTMSSDEKMMEERKALGGGEIEKDFDIL